jgi:hypothetical protein
MAKKSKSLYNLEEQKSMKQPSHILVTIKQRDTTGIPKTVTRTDVNSNSKRLTQILSRVPEFVEVYTNPLSKSLRYREFDYFVKYKGEESGLRKIAKTLKKQMAGEGIWAHYPGGVSYLIDSEDFISGVMKDYKEYSKYEEESRKEDEYFKIVEEDRKRCIEALQKGEIDLDTPFVV